jgi:hypothetical protein
VPRHEQALVPVALPKGVERLARALTIVREEGLALFQGESEGAQALDHLHTHQTAFSPNRRLLPALQSRVYPNPRPS